MTTRIRKWWRRHHRRPFDWYEELPELRTPSHVHVVSRFVSAGGPFGLDADDRQ